MDSDRLDREKIRAELMKHTAETYSDSAYWHAYRMGLAARSEPHDALLALVGSPDTGAAARGRGYRDGCTFREVHP